MAMKLKQWIISVCMCMMMLFDITAFAQPADVLADSSECEEIYALEDKILEQVNYGSARGEIDSEQLVDGIDFDDAYKVYSNSELFKADSFDKNVLMEDILGNSHYIWQIPVFIDGNTIIFDVVKVTEIPDDAPEDIQEDLLEILDQWTLGATHIYENRIVNFKKNIDDSLEAAGLNPDDYTYAFVSGLPQIRYPVAVIFGEEAEYIIPAEEAAAHAFNDGAEKMEYRTSDEIISEETASEASPSNAYRNSTGKGFAVYDFNQVADAVESSLPGLRGGGIGGINGKQDYMMDLIGIFVIIGIGIIVIGIRKLRHK